MNESSSKSPFIPALFAVGFFLILIVLALLYPISFWAGNDYEPLGLANALNMAFRLADHRMYPAIGMAGHPGVPFYLMNWLALALAGYPVATGELEFFRTVVAQVQHYQRIAILLAAIVGAAGVYIFARAARPLVPAWVILCGLLIWLVSTPASITTFLHPSNESFALLLNALFFVALLRLANEGRPQPGTYVFCGTVSALAYLTKLAYIYVPLALVCVVGVQFVFSKDRNRLSWCVAGSYLAFGATVLAIAAILIGWNEFRSLLSFHRGVIVGSGLYGAGSHTVISPDELRGAILAVPVDRAYAVFIALITGFALVVAGTLEILKERRQIAEATIGIGSGFAALLSAVFVVKHYGLHYTAGVSATLPACVVSCYLLARSRRFRQGIAIATLAILLMAYPVLGGVRDILDAQLERTRLAELDLKEILDLAAGSKKVVGFAYRTPFAQYAEGFILYYAGVQRLTNAYVRDRHGMTNSLTEGLVAEEVGIYVIDKEYFPNADAVRQAPNVDLLGPKPVRYREGDKLIELRTVFLLVRDEIVSDLLANPK